MKSCHRLVISDSRDLSWIDGETVDLVVTSPPYPMIEMWDHLFGELNPEILRKLQQERGLESYELMHRELDKVWVELHRVLKKGGILCLNVGDATRTLGHGFQLYPNHARILERVVNIGFQVLPEIVWRKQTNAPNKFVGSGTLPAGAYVTLEHEWILLLRKGARRRFQTPEEKKNRLASAFFWEERNSWFSDVWDFKGVRQDIEGGSRRKRSGAFPFELAYRLINMFSVKGDLVLDCFAGAGTTMLAAMCAARNSLSAEIDETMTPVVEAGALDIASRANRKILQRLTDHQAFIGECRERGRVLKHRNSHYGFPVVSAQEREILLNYVRTCKKTGQGQWELEYQPEAKLTIRL